MSTKLLDAERATLGPILWTPARPVRPQPEVNELPATDPAEELRRAYAAGLNEGESRARSYAEQQTGEWAGRLASQLSELSMVRTKALAQAQADVVRLSLEIARRVLHREVSVEPKAIAALVKAALEKLGLQERYTARVHPALATVVRQCIAEARGDARLEIITDPSLRPGDVVFESIQGALDASIETQLSEIERGLAQLLEACDGR